jgi:hypothetical protein
MLSLSIQKLVERSLFLFVLFGKMLFNRKLHKVALSCRLPIASNAMSRDLRHVDAEPLNSSFFDCLYERVIANRNRLRLATEHQGYMDANRSAALWTLIHCVSPSSKRNFIFKSFPSSIILRLLLAKVKMLFPHLHLDLVPSTKDRMPSLVHPLGRVVGPFPEHQVDIPIGEPGSHLIVVELAPRTL